jgi:serine/threonine-protein kinase
MLDTHTTLPTVTATEAEPAPAGPPAGRRTRWLLLSLTAVVVAALGVGGWWYMTAGPGAYTTVPVGLHGSRLADAEATLTEVGLAVTTIEAFDPKEPAGEVLRVSPVEDTSILKDGTVTLTVSKGPDLRDVTVEPTGQSLEAVEAALTSAGFEVLPAELVYSDTVPAGTVISAADDDGVPVEIGARLPVGTMITLTCSDGLQPVTIPAVVGMPRDAAVAALGDLGLAVTESQAYSSEVAAGIVKLQSPEAGAAGHRLDTVAIVVSLGPEPAPPKPAPSAGGVLVPNLVGMYKYPAWSTISDLGFTGEHVDTGCTRLGELGYEHCVVESQSPAPGTRQPAGSLITIYLRDE